MHIPNVNIPRSGPAATPPKLIERGRILPRFSTTNTIPVLKVPKITTRHFIILLAVFSVVCFGINGLMKSSYIVPAKVFKQAERVLKKKKDY